MSNDGDLDWRGTWPWGRTAPLKRLEDLRRRLTEAADRRRRLEGIFKERLIDIDRLAESIEHDIEIAQKCEDDRCRRLATALIEDLLRRGIKVPESLAKKKPDLGVISELRLLAKGVPELEQEVTVEMSNGVLPASQVGFEEMAGLARRRRT